MSAQDRASLALRAEVGLKPLSVQELIKQAAGNVKGGGASLLTTGLQNVGAQVNVERESPGLLNFSITSGKRIFELCTFSARVEWADDRSRVVVGGLETYKTTQSTIGGFIPAGPKMIAGMAPYKSFLHAVETVLRGADPSASISIQ